MTIVGPKTIMLAKPDYSLLNDDTHMDNPELENDLNLIRDKLKSKGFEVIRNSVPIFKAENGEERIAFYNNCLVEVNKHGKNIQSRKVWLPKFETSWSELKGFDESNKQTWKNLEFEFEVEFIDSDFKEIVSQDGVIHCLTKTLFRK